MRAGLRRELCAPMVGAGPSYVGNATQGKAGSSGQNAYTTLTANFTMPAANGTTQATATVGNTGWAAQGQYIFIAGGAYVQIATITDATHLQVTNPGFAISVAPATVINAGAAVSPSGPPGSDALGIFGDGSDGVATCDGLTAVAGMSLSGGNYTLTRDVYFATLTVNVGITVNYGGYRLFCAGLLTVNGHVSADGGAGLQASSGQGGTTGPANKGLNHGGTGNSGGGASAPVASSLGGQGGTSASGAGGAVTTPNAAVGATTPRSLFEAIMGWSWVLAGSAPTITSVAGGSGGGSVSADGGAGGGGGGNYLVVVAFALGGSGSITSAGGAGATSPTTGHYGGGGGGGGVVVLVTRSKAAWTGSVSAAGGAGGAGSITAGTNGGAGTVLALQG
jgi:hypothetical protein